MSFSASPMRAALSGLLSLSVLSACAGFPAVSNTMPTSTPIPVPAGWSLVWHDEFEGSAINRQNWTYDLGGGGWGNGESQIYTDKPENARVENGLLVIEAHREVNANGGFSFTSARLKTQGLQTFQYGRIEARLKVPEGRGFWPAFWMLGANIETTPWPDCGEIDVMEYMGREPDLVLGTLHGPGYSASGGLTKWFRQEHKIADDFRVFAVEWDAEKIVWFYEGVAYHTVTRTDVGARPWVFDQPFFIILNLAIGGTLGGLVSPQTPFPAQYLVDYVRVYQRVP